MEEFESQYPQKPILTRQNHKKHISITILSIILFAITFFFIIDDYYFIIIILGALLFHEFGHFLMMKLFKYKDLNMLFIPFMGAMVSGRKKEYSQVQSAIMIIAGPLPGIVIGSVLLLYYSGNPLATQLGVILILINVINLVPVDPLDGGQLMRVLFFNKFEFTQLVFTILSSLFIALSGLYFNSWIIIIFGLLLGFRIKNKHKLYLIHKQMKKQKVGFEANYEDISNKTYSKITNIVLEHTPVLEEIKEYNGEERYDQLMAKQVDGVLFPPTKKDASVYFKIFMMVLWAGSILLSIYAILFLDFNSIVHAFQSR